jgi:hypothetical protein
MVGQSYHCIILYEDVFQNPLISRRTVIGQNMSATPIAATSNCSNKVQMIRPQVVCKQFLIFKKTIALLEFVLSRPLLSNVISF